jgi:hypothetical protein
VIRFLRLLRLRQMRHTRDMRNLWPSRLLHLRSRLAVPPVHQLTDARAAPSTTLRPEPAPCALLALLGGFWKDLVQFFVHGSLVRVKGVGRVDKVVDGVVEGREVDLGRVVAVLGYSLDSACVS